MKFSKLFAPTTKENPKDATLPSHQYLVRGGFVTQVGSGIYDFLPLGKIVLDKIRAVVKEELDAVGAQETLLGFVTPAELWVESGRYGKFGKELLRFKDRKENEFVLGPTHEEMMVDLVRNRIKSYKQLPMNLYQIHTKFRDEARPRFGLLRGREFIMKDGYSFHENQEDMKREYALMEETYSKILKRLGLDFRVVEADSGAIGGSGSKEFMVLAQNGEDDILLCKKCSYAANVEAAKRQKRKAPDGETPEMTKNRFWTPNISKIEDLAAFFRVDPYYTIKAIAKKAIYQDGAEIVVFFVRGSDNLQERKGQNSVGALELVDVSDEELLQSGLVAGFMGPQAQGGFKIVIDEELRGEKNLICGANEKDYHLIGFDMNCVENGRYFDLVEVSKSDLCPCCGGELEISKGIEVGHIFQLGQTYSKPLSATFLDRNGKAEYFWMGTFGIGVSRLVAVVIEQSHDEKGCVWTKSTAPYLIDIVVSNIKDRGQNEFAQQLYADFKAQGLDVILDDRDERFGFKMSDFELIGFPYALIVGKELGEGKVQLVNRKTLEKRTIDKDMAIKTVMEII